MYRGSVAKCEFGCGKVWDWDREKREREAEDRRKEVQAEYRKQLIVLGDESLSLFESAPKHLSAAEEQLDQAEIDFGDRAFAPFWDSIENAAKSLAHFDAGVHHIRDHSSRYTELVRKYDDSPPQFPLARESVAKLGIGAATATRMQAIVRQAQRDFQFATIYEQRKTNQLLVSGFTNLANALSDMTWRITDSIADLTSSVDVMASTLNESLRAIHSRVGDLAERTSQHHEELMAGLNDRASQAAARERKALEMLNNIQRGRRPAP
jgi:hypothetical protein